MLEIESYNQSNLSWNAAFRAGLVLTDSFRRDFAACEFKPTWLQLKNVPVASYASLLAFPPFRLTVMHNARMFYLMVRRNPRYLIYLVKDTENKGQYVGIGTFILPEYYPDPPKASGSQLWYKIKTWLISVYFRLQEIWTFKSLNNPFYSAELIDEFEYATEKCEMAATDELRARLSKLSYEEMSKRHVPKPMAYCMHYFGVVDGQQGKGYGKRIMDLLLQTLTTQYKIIPHPQLNSPPKMVFFSSPIGVGFYKKYGFKVGTTSPVKTKYEAAQSVVHTCFFTNLAE